MVNTDGGDAPIDNGIVKCQTGNIYYYDNGLRATRKTVDVAIVPVYEIVFSHEDKIYYARVSTLDWMRLCDIILTE